MGMETAAEHGDIGGGLSSGASAQKNGENSRLRSFKLKVYKTAVTHY